VINNKPYQSTLFILVAGLAWNPALLADIGRECKDQNSKIFGLFFDSAATQACVDRRLAEERTMIDQQYSQHGHNQGALTDADFRDQFRDLMSSQQATEDGLTKNSRELYQSLTPQAQTIERKTTHTGYPPPVLKGYEALEGKTD